MGERNRAKGEREEDISGGEATGVRLLAPSFIFYSRPTLIAQFANKTVL